jgi:transposase
MATVEATASFSSPEQVARKYGVSADKVRAWILQGELRAVNAAVNPAGQRPRWRIAEADLLAFFERRANLVHAKPKTTRRKKTETPEHNYF